MSVLIREEQREIWDTEGGYVMTEAETGVVRLQAKDG